MLTAELAERFSTLFRGNEQFHGQYVDATTDDKKRIWTKAGPPPASLWLDHLSGRGPYLGVIPIQSDNTVYWGAIDVDDDGVDQRALAVKIKELKLPLVVCRSKSGGAHLYVFFNESVPAKLAQQKLKEWATAIGHKHNADGRAIEVFPKQQKLKKGEKGSWINLPYYGGDSTNRYAVNADGEKLTLELFLTVAEMLKLSQARLETTKPAGADPFDEGPPCLKTLHMLGMPAGSRNQGLYNIACYFKLAHPDEWQDMVREYNETYYDPPKDAREVEALIKSVDARDYTYKCNELPIEPHCQKRECKKAKYGIDAFRRQRSIAAFPDVKNLRKIMTDPPTWQLEVNDVDVTLQTDDLSNIIRFQRAVLEKVSILVPNLKQTEWHDLVRELLEDHIMVEAPEDAGVEGMFQYLVREFLLLRKKADKREDLQRGLPVEEEGKVYFRGHDLMQFFDRKKFREYNMNQVWNSLRKTGAGHHQFNIKGACVRVWWVPVPKDEQTEEFEVSQSMNTEF